MLDPIYKTIGWLLAVFYQYVPPHNLGIAIILLTCTVMLVLFPLTAKQARSMIAMQKVQPEIKKIQQRYKDDKQKQNEEVMKFYQENKINPLAGCLPLLLQMPIFISLFHVLRSIPTNVPTSGTFTRLFTDICPNAADAAACTEPKGLHFLGMDLSVAPLKASGSFLETLPYFLLVGVVIFTGWYQTRQTMSRQASSGAAGNSQAQIVGKVMPIFIGVISLNFVTGLVVYFATSNIWRIGQQQVVLNKLYDQAPTAKTVEAASRDVSDDAGSGSTEDSGGEASRPARANPNTSRKKRKKRKR